MAIGSQWHATTTTIRGRTASRKTKLAMLSLAEALLGLCSMRKKQLCVYEASKMCVFYIHMVYHGILTYVITHSS